MCSKLLASRIIACVCFTLFLAMLLFHAIGFDKTLDEKTFDYTCPPIVLLPDITKVVIAEKEPTIKTPMVPTAIIAATVKATWKNNVWIGLTSDGDAYERCFANGCDPDEVKLIAGGPKTKQTKSVTWNAKTGDYYVVVGVASDLCKPGKTIDETVVIKIHVQLSVAMLAISIIMLVLCIAVVLVPIYRIQREDKSDPETLEPLLSA